MAEELNYTPKLLELTIPFMKSTDYKQRFIAEYLQLKIRLIGLDKIISDYENDSLQFEPVCNIVILQQQSTVMHQYLDILRTRAHFEEIDVDKEDI